MSEIMNGTAALVAKLKGSSELAELLQATPQDSRIFPYRANGLEKPSIAYDWTDLKREDPNFTRVQFDITSPKFTTTARIAERVIKLLEILEPDAGYWYAEVNVLACALNGGGRMESFEQEDVYQRTLIFDLIWR